VPQRAFISSASSGVAAARDELGDLVPVDEVRECLGEDVAQAKTLQLLDAPGMDQQLLVDCVLDELGI